MSTNEANVTLLGHLLDFLGRAIAFLGNLVTLLGGALTILENTSAIANLSSALNTIAILETSLRSQFWQLSLRSLIPLKLAAIAIPSAALP